MSDEPLLAELRRLEIETPSWGYGNSGTRFHVYPWPGAHRVYMEAFETDVRPLLARLRESLGVEADPVEAFRAGGYADRLAKERGAAGVESAYERL